MMKVVCRACVSQALLLTAHTTGPNKMYLFKAYTSLIWFAMHTTLTGTFIQEGITAWEAQVGDLKSGPNTRMVSVLLVTGMGDGRITETWKQYTNQIPCLKPDSSSLCSSGRYSWGNTHSCYYGVLPCLFLRLPVASEQEAPPTSQLIQLIVF